MLKLRTNVLKATLIVPTERPTPASVSYYVSTISLIIHSPCAEHQLPTCNFPSFTHFAFKNPPMDKNISAVNKDNFSDDQHSNERLAEKLDVYQVDIHRAFYQPPLSG